MTTDRLWIGQLAEAIGVNPRTIRYYEAIGLLPRARRTDEGYRLYAPDDLERLRFVRGARTLGLSLAEIQSILTFRDRGEPPCEHVLYLIESRLRDVQAQIDALSKLRSELERLRDEGRRLPTDAIATRDCVCHLIGRRALGQTTDRHA
jgi:DNA-binding transcriptional MerR regulator